jgi:hypothetical protein
MTAGHARSTRRGKRKAAKFIFVFVQKPLETIANHHYIRGEGRGEEVKKKVVVSLLARLALAVAEHAFSSAALSPPRGRSVGEHVSMKSVAAMVATEEDK